MISSFRRLLGRSEALQTSFSSLMIVLVRVGGNVATLLYTLLMARMMPVADVGIVWAIWSSSFVAATFTTLNIGASAVSELAKARANGRDDLAAGFVVTSRRVLLYATLPVVAGYLAFMYLIEPEPVQAHPTAFLIGAISLPILGWVQLNATQAAALFRALYSQAPRELIRPLVFLCVLSLCAAVTYVPSVEFVIATYLASVILMAILQFALLRSAFGFMAGTVPDLSNWRHWIGTGLFLAPTRILGENLKNLFVMSAAWGLSNQDTARFAIALSLVSLLNFGISAVDMTFSPRVAAAMARNETRRRETMLMVSSALKVVPISAAVVVLITFVDPILELFGPEYAAASDVTLWLMIMPVAKAFFGPADFVLQFAGLHRTIFANALVGILFISASLSVLGWLEGPIAAAIGGAVSYAMLQCAQWAVCRSRTGVDTSVIGAVRNAAKFANGRV